MKSIVALAAFIGGMVSLQGCGSSGDDTPDAPPTCDYGRAASDSFVCPGHGNREVYLAMFNDIADGDVKQVQWAGNTMNISGSGPEGPWIVVATLDEATCSGSVDFRVAGKLNPPDGPLTATIYSSLVVEKDCKSPFKYVISFSTDSVADTATNSSFVNQWVEANPVEDHVESTNITCPTQLAGDFTCVAGVLWDVKIDGSSLTLKPGAGNAQDWTVEAEIDATDCSATVNIPGSGFDQLAQIRLSVMAGQTVKDAMANPLYYVMFSDATGTGRPPLTGPINQWTQLSTQQQLV